MAIVAVSADEYLREVGDRPFIGLPREEIERLYGSVELSVLERASDGYLPLHTYVAVHYNYAWLTYASERRSLGIKADVPVEGDAPPFLDRVFEQLARRTVDPTLVTPAACEWRLAGLINDGRELGLVYLARLRRAVEGPNPALQMSGNTELRFAREAFDPWSQLLIDNLDAF